MKDKSRRKYTDKEKIFIKTYGEKNFLVWETLSVQEQADFKEIKSLYYSFVNLLEEYYDDLRMFAIMYRNVPLYNIANDALSVMFFVSKRDQIIGFRQKVESMNTEKNQVASSFYKYGGSFAIVCNRYLGKEFFNTKSILSYGLELSSLEDFKKGNIPHVNSVCDLSIDDCVKILAHKTSYLNDIQSVFPVNYQKPSSYSFFTYENLINDFVSNISNNRQLLSNYVTYVLGHDRKEAPSNRDLRSSFSYSRIDRWMRLSEEDWHFDLNSDIQDIRKNDIDLLTDILPKISKLSEDIIVLYPDPLLQDISDWDIRFLVDRCKKKLNITSFHDDYWQMETRLDDLLKLLNSSICKQYADQVAYMYIHDDYRAAKIESYERFIFTYESSRTDEERLHLLSDKSVDRYLFSKPIPLMGTPEYIQYIIDKAKKDRQELDRLKNIYEDSKNKLRKLREEERILSGNRLKDKQKKEAKIEEYKGLILSYKDELSELKDGLYKYCIKYIRSCKLYVFEQNKINLFIESSYLRLYSLLWLRFPNIIRQIEKKSTGSSSVPSLLKKQEWLTCSPFIWHRKEDVIKFSERILMTKWIDLIIERTEIEQAAKERKERERREIELTQRKIEIERKRKEEEERLAQFRYNERNKHNRDQYLIFDGKTHTYTIGGVALQSVTNFVENCFPKFDAELHARPVAARMGISTQEVISMWERKGQESRDLGTAMHSKIEKFYQGISSQEDETFRLFKMFASKITLKPYRTEWAVYDEQFKIAGTIDFVDYQNGKYTIYDWKRSEKLVANEMPIKTSRYKSTGLYPLEHIEDCPYYHYALQLSLYKFILERSYNIKVDDLRLGVFHPSYSKPYVLKMPYLEKEVNDLMALRSEVVY